MNTTLPEVSDELAEFISFSKSTDDVIEKMQAYATAALEAAEARHREELAAYELTCQNLRERAAEEIATLKDHVDSEGTRAVEHLRRARKAEAELAQRGEPAIDPKACLWARNGHHCCPSTDYPRGQADKALAAQPQTVDEAMELPRELAKAYENGWSAATAAERERMEKHCAELSQDAYNRWRADGNPYDDGQCDAANALADKIRSGE